jgi:PTH1 family peptidyl-tRNA hydrolase
MRLIVGLGNPGEKYTNNRHNVGDMAVDALLRKNLPKHFVVKKSDVMMNNSGIFVKKLVEQYRLNLSDLWVIHDDLDIPLGSYKIQKGKGPKLHKGILSIEKELGTDEFWRVRIGVDNRLGDKTPGEQYVLQDFTKEEKDILNKAIEEVVGELKGSALRVTS